MKMTAWWLCNRWHFRACSQIILKHGSAKRRRFAVVYLHLQTEVSDFHAPGWNTGVPWYDWHWRSGENYFLHIQVNIFICRETLFPQDGANFFFILLFLFNFQSSYSSFSFISFLKTVEYFPLSLFKRSTFISFSYLSIYLTQYLFQILSFSASYPTSLSRFILPNNIQFL